MTLTKLEVSHCLSTQHHLCKRLMPFSDPRNPWCDQSTVLTACRALLRALSLTVRDADIPCAAALQAKPLSIFAQAAGSEQPGARRNTPRPFVHRRGGAALTEQPLTVDEPGGKPDFSRFQCGAAPLPPRNQLPGTLIL